MNISPPPSALTKKKPISDTQRGAVWQGVRRRDHQQKAPRWLTRRCVFDHIFLMLHICRTLSFSRIKINDI
jgi:hypothetical protein